MSADLKLEPSWKLALSAEFNQAYLLDLKQFLRAEKDKRKIIYPKGADIFKAFSLTPKDQVKVVILGQDPYHGRGQAHGLCFSVTEGVRVPPSLVNIYKELASDVGIPCATQGCLERWATQGVLLLNSVLTVEAGQAASHQGRGWEQFTDKVIELLNQDDRPKAFVLWGSYAQRKGQFIDGKKHLVLKSSHPSPLSAHRDFFGSKPFSKINQFLTETEQTPIDWSV